MVKKILIPAEDSSHATMAAQKYFGKKIKMVPFNNEELPSFSTGDHVVILAIENSITGSILPNYALVQKSDLKITGEVWVETGNNYTRFVILEPKNVPDPPEINKASVYFEVDDSKGRLVKVLSILEKANINLSKLQSLPIPERQWAYGFHTDMEFGSLPDFNDAVDEMKTSAGRIFIYGKYKKGQLPLY